MKRATYHDRLEMLHAQDVRLVCGEFSFGIHLLIAEELLLRDPFCIDAVQTTDLPPFFAAYHRLDLFWAEPFDEEISRGVARLQRDLYGRDGRPGRGRYMCVCAARKAALSAGDFGQRDGMDSLQGLEGLDSVVGAHVYESLHDVERPVRWVPVQRPGRLELTATHSSKNTSSVATSFLSPSFSLRVLVFAWLKKVLMTTAGRLSAVCDAHGRDPPGVMCMAAVAVLTGMGE